MAKVGVIGYGVVGQATGKGFSRVHDVLWHDPYKNPPAGEVGGSTSVEDLVKHSEFLFVCVPTPMFSDYSGTDLSIVEKVVETFVPLLDNTDKILIIKSTVIPGTTAKFAKKYPRVNFAFNPEFLTEAHPEQDFLHPDRTLIGAEDLVAVRIKALYEAIYPVDAKYFLSDSTTCELAKYVSNALLSAKIILANEVYHVARALKVDYDQVREMVQADLRIGGHLKVPGPDGDLGFGGKCFPKDIVGFLGLARSLDVDLSVFKEVWKKNLEVRKNQDWLEIPGAVTKMPNGISNSKHETLNPKQAPNFSIQKPKIV